MEDRLKADAIDEGVSSPIGSSRARESRVLRLILSNPVVPLLIITIPLFAVLVPGYAESANLRNVLLQSAVLMLLVVGGGVVLITGNFDLSSEGTLVFTAVVGAWLMADSRPGSGWGLPPALAIAAMVGIGAAVGLINGTLIAVLKVNAFVVTLAMLMTLRGAAAIPTRGQTIVGLPDGFSWVGQSSTAGVSNIVLVAMIIYVVVAIWFSTSTYGRHAYAIGGDLTAARENGVRSSRVIIGAYVLSGVLAALAGWLSAARLDSASADLGNGIIFTAIAALVIGGVSLTGGSGNLFGALGGVWILGSISSVINLLAINPIYINFIRGAVLIGAVLIIVMRLRLAARLGIRDVS
jgi:ribose/xylose/arabinose/galactoside ABC-type transport system permease subunit